MMAAREILVGLKDLQLRDREHQHQGQRTRFSHLNSQAQRSAQDFKAPERYGLEIGDVTLICSHTTERFYNDRSPINTAMGRRHNGRLALGSLLEYLFRHYSSQKQYVEQVLRRVLSAAPEWLNDFENEMLGEKTMLKVHAYTEEDQQRSARWEAESASQRDLWSRALKLVLEKQADERDGRPKRAVSILARITQATNSAFPPELLILITKFVIESQLPRCTFTSLHTLEALAAELFATSEGTPSRIRDMLQQTAAEELVKISSIRIAAKFNQPSTLTIPPALAGKEHHIRHLELDLRVRVFNDWPQTQLNRSIAGMASMASSFVVLETCVILCHFQHHGMTNIENTSPAQNTIGTDMLNIRVSPQSPGMTTLQDSLLAFIKAFTEQGPGKQKFIRFRHFSREGEDAGAGSLILAKRRPQRTLDRACRELLTWPPDADRPKKSQVVTLQDDCSLNFVTKSS